MRSIKAGVIAVIVFFVAFPILYAVLEFFFR